jgi:hypothetical protein
MQIDSRSTHISIFHDRGGSGWTGGRSSNLMLPPMKQTWAKGQSACTRMLPDAAQGPWLERFLRTPPLVSGAPIAPWTRRLQTNQSAGRRQMGRSVQRGTPSRALPSDTGTAAAHGHRRADRTQQLVFLVEKHLEDFLEVHLTRLLSVLGQDVLIIKRQVNGIGSKRRIDLLGIDARGVIYIIELKVTKTSPVVISQLIDYQSWIEELDKNAIIRLVAGGIYGVDLSVAFQRHFGHPLVDTVNVTQVLVLIAPSFDSRTARCIVNLNKHGYSAAAFRYVVESDAVSITPCGPDDGEEDSARNERPVVGRRRLIPRAQRSSPPYRVNIDEAIRLFWLTLSQQFTLPMMSHQFVYGQYVQAAKDMHLSPLAGAQFSRQSVAIMAQTGEWAHVFVAPESGIRLDGTLRSPPSTELTRTLTHGIAAYLRKPKVPSPETR